ncbi:hypothetical protein NIES2104_67390 [Leptolyngbya sp. NIES-2104]|nr:hypothetical protein NIES2104_67390 [Leptolyngbya sp. NIES-2104]
MTYLAVSLPILHFSYQSKSNLLELLNLSKVGTEPTLKHLAQFTFFESS